MNYVQRCISACMTGRTNLISRSISDMMRHCRKCNYASPWFGNTPGNPNSKGYYEWLDSQGLLVDNYDID